MSVRTTVGSGARIDGSFAPANILQVGGDGSQPTDIIIYNGRLMVLNADGQTTIEGGVVQAVGVAAGAITAEKLNIAERGYIHNIAFDPVAKNKVDWSAGTIYFTGGDSVNITAGTTGALSQPAYIYYDSVAGQLKATPDAEVAVAGANVALIKVTPQDDPDERALIQDFRGGSTTIDADQIVTGKISADRLEIGYVNFISDVSFSPDGADKLNWASGTIETATGQTRAIDSGTTGNLSKRSSAPSSDGNTVGLWHFDETSGTGADNAEGTSALDGTATGTTIVSEGRFDYCRFFDGSDDYVSVSDNAALDLTTFTVEVSFKYGQAADNSEHVILGRENTTSSSWPYRILINGDGYLQFDIRPNTNLTYTLISQIEMNDAQWHDVVATFDATANTMVLWIDNVKHATRTNCFTDPQASAEPLMIGRSNAGGGSKYFQGYIDEIRLSSTVRTVTTAAQQYIYWDNNPVLKVTTNKSNTVGANKILMAIMTPKENYGSAEVQVFGNEGTIIDGDKIQTGRISSADGKTYFDLNERRLLMTDASNDPRLVLGFGPGLF